ncbi:hypothetical protein ACLMJK_007432 [Lecanora helva]
MEVVVNDQQEEFSDYGSDFTPDEEEILKDLLQGPYQEPDNPIEDPDLQLKDADDEIIPRGARVRTMGLELRALQNATKAKSVRIQVDGDGDHAANIESAASRTERERSVSIEAPLDPTPEVPDLRSPLERFRTKPKKALSVTDLISPSWCELQYWFVLTKHGKKRRTPAMKQGSVVHQKLEDQVHQTVPVDIVTKEDAWGLRIWNVIQGLKTLRETGMTRELEIWGTVDGLVVNGVIDELSYICPDPELEAKQEKNSAKNTLPADQATITDFFGGSSLETNGQGIMHNLRSRESTPKIYLTDVKIRGSKSIPKDPSFRPTLMQLMLYHHLLSNLASNKVNADIIFDRYGLDPDVTFSDSFIAQISSLDEALDTPQSSLETSSSSPSTQDPTTLLLTHNTLRLLWSLMITSFQSTMPHGAASLGPVLKAEYRSPDDGEIMGVKTFLHDSKQMQEYLDDEMRWWKGERGARGVCVEEAYKCGSCEFADECEWRRGKILEATEKMRRSRSVV